MSQENVEVVRRGYEMFVAGDLQGVAALFASDAEVADAGGLGTTGAATGTRFGPEGFLRTMQDAVDAFEDYEVAPEKFTAVGDAVLVHVRVTGRGRASGVPLEARVVQAWVLRDGQVVRAEVYTDEKEALEAVGLRE